MGTPARPERASVQTPRAGDVRVLLPAQRNDELRFWLDTFRDQIAQPIVRAATLEAAEALLAQHLPSAVQILRMLTEPLVGYDPGVLARNSVAAVGKVAQRAAAGRSRLDEAIATNALWAQRALAHGETLIRERLRQLVEAHGADALAVAGNRAFRQMQRLESTAGVLGLLVGAIVAGEVRPRSKKIALALAEKAHEAALTFGVAVKHWSATALPRSTSPRAPSPLPRPGTRSTAARSSLPPPGTASRSAR